MVNLLFLTSLTLLCVLVLYWGFRCLPHRQWQIWATVPSYDRLSESWQGINLTWYGLLTASANLTALTVSFCLLGSLGISRTAMVVLACALLAGCLPASRWVARLVEGKSHTFTVGGAVFVGFVLAPCIIAILNALKGRPLPMLPTLTALAIGYAFGEGIGRLACISYGCCYGKPLGECGPLLRKLFGRFHFVFRGETKKIAYASGLDGQAVVPIQALTALLFCLTGLAGTALFLAGHYGFAFLLVCLVTQGWRVFSEMLRADYRGRGKLSAYQIMGLLLLPYAVGLVLYYAAFPALPDLSMGLAALWHPAVLLALQAGWLIMFLFFGRSEVTGANLSFFVRQDRI